jgi:hypothetical protein
MSHMYMRKAIPIAAILLLPLIAFGQQQAAATEAEQALRARVTEFLQYHVEGNFRKAYDLIADDTKDEYFNGGKAQLKGFTIDKLVFNDDKFTRATVTATLSKTVIVIGQEFPATVPSITTWKIENGKWVWTSDVKPAWNTPMDPPNSRRPEATAPANNDTAGLPKVLDENALATATQSILQQVGQQVGVDKREVTLSTNAVSEDRVVFHNGMPGSVQLELGVPDIPGFSAKVGQMFISTGADGAVVFRYEPPQDPGKRRVAPITMEVVVQPLNQTFSIRVNFANLSPANKK